MRLLILALLFLSLITAFISEGSLKNTIAHFASFVLQSILCFYTLLISNFVFLYMMFGTANLSGIISGQQVIYTPDDFCLIALWFLFQVIICVIIIICSRLIDCHKKGVSIRLFSKRQEHGFCALLFISFIFIGVTVSLKSWSETQLLISEVRSTSELAKDEDVIGEYEESKSEFSGDYIELYNPTPFNIKLSHFYVTDDLNEQPKQAAKNDVIPAGDYAVVWTEEGDNNFSINNDGNEVIYLLNSSENIIDSVTIPELKRGTVYARNDTDAGWGVYEPSPLETNTGDEIKYVSDPVFSAESGFYDEPFTLKISAPDGCRIYYTIDSSIPDENSFLYDDGIEITNICNEPNVYRAVQNVRTNWKYYTPPTDPVDKALVIRAVAIDDQDNRSLVITKTYFVDMDEYKNQYVLSLVSDPDDLFGEDGIYVTGKAYDEWYLGDQTEMEPTVNFKEKGDDWEIETFLELFNDDLLMAQSAGMRIQGHERRGYELKPFSIYSRNKYSGSRYFIYDIFDCPLHSFMLREDFADAFMQSLVPDRGIGGMKAVKTSVFLNGEFWYDAYIREKYSEDYLSQKYNLDRGNVILVETTPDEIYSFLDTHDLSYSEDYMAFNEIIDIQNYIDFITVNVYLCNMDRTENHNLKMWKTNGNSGIGLDDGRWRFLLYDMDMVFRNNIDYYHVPSYGINTFSTVQNFDYVSYDQEKIFAALLTSDIFRKQFVLTFMDFANTYFEQSNVERQLIEWGYDLTWCDDFFAKRFDYIVPDLAEEFNLTGTLEEITLKIDQINSGTITVNTVTPDLSGGEWSGYYYTDYPVTISAIPSEGYEFVGWKHNDEIYEDSVLEVELTDDNNVWEAEFVKE